MNNYTCKDGTLFFIQNAGHPNLFNIVARHGDDDDKISGLMSLATAQATIDKIARNDARDYPDEKLEVNGAPDGCI